MCVVRMSRNSLLFLSIDECLFGTVEAALEPYLEGMEISITLSSVCQVSEKKYSQVEHVSERAEDWH